MNSQLTRSILVPDSTRSLDRRWAFLYTNQENLIPFDIGDDEFKSMCDSGILDDLSEHYGVIVDEYECAEIASDFDWLAGYADEKADCCPVFHDAVMKAIKLNTAIALCL